MPFGTGNGWRGFLCETLRHPLLPGPRNCILKPVQNARNVVTLLQNLSGNVAALVRVSPPPALWMRRACAPSRIACPVHARPGNSDSAPIAARAAEPPPSRERTSTRPATRILRSQAARRSEPRGEDAFGCSRRPRVRGETMKLRVLDRRLVGKIGPVAVPILNSPSRQGRLELRSFPGVRTSCALA
jgi:hypothetical protein